MTLRPQVLDESPSSRRQIFARFGLELAARTFPNAFLAESLLQFRYMFFCFSVLYFFLVATELLRIHTIADSALPRVHEIVVQLVLVRHRVHGQVDIFIANSHQVAR